MGRDNSRVRENFHLSPVLWCWPPQARVGLSATLIKHDKGKGPATAALSAPSKYKKKPQKERQRQKNKKLPNTSNWLSPLFIPLFFPKLPVWAACCCRVSHWGSWAVPWSSRWPFAALWLKAQHLFWHFGVCQCDAVGTPCAAAEKRRSSAGLSLASSSSSTSFSLLSSLVPKAQAVHRLTGGSTRRRLRFDKCTDKSLFRSYYWELTVVCKSVFAHMYAQVKTVMMNIFSEFQVLKPLDLLNTCFRSTVCTNIEWYSRFN